MLGVGMLTAFTLSVVMKSVMILSFFMQSVIILIIIFASVVLLSVVLFLDSLYADCNHAEYCFLSAIMPNVSVINVFILNVVMKSV